MRPWHSQITVLSLACAGLLLAGAPLFAQTSSGGGSFGGGGSSGSSFGGGGSSFGGGSSSGGSFGGSSGGMSFGGSGLGSPSSSGGGAFGGSSFTGGVSGTSGSSTSSVPGRSGPSAAVGATSFLGSSYGDPLAGAGGLTTKGKFGTPQFTLTNTAQNGTASTRTSRSTNEYFGGPIGARRLPAYATTLKIKDMPPPETPAEVRTDLQVMLARSGQLDPRDAVRVLMDGPAVVLQGEVVDNDERRLVENMVLLTPGVNAVRNELAPRNPAP